VTGRVANGKGSVNKTEYQPPQGGFFVIRDGEKAVKVV